MCAACRLSLPWVAGLAICAVLIVVLGLLPWVIVGFVTNPEQPAGDAKQWDIWLFWIQTAAGNWSPPDHRIVSPWWLAFSAIVAVLLNNGLVWVLLLFVWRSIVNWRRNMRLSQAVAVRDQLNKQALFDAFGDDPATVSKIQRAFAVGEEMWGAELQALFGEREAGRLREALPKEISL